MKNILLVYSTFAGATEDITQALYKVLVEDYPLLKFEIEGIRKVDPVLLNKFDLIIFGASTYDGEMNFDASEFFSKLETNKKDLQGLKFALFGTGDRAYLEFCGGVDKIKEKIIAVKGEVEGEILRLEIYPVSDAIAKLKIWVQSFIAV